MLSAAPAAAPKRASASASSSRGFLRAWVRILLIVFFLPPVLVWWIVVGSAAFVRSSAPVRASSPSSGCPGLAPVVSLIALGLTAPTSTSSASVGIVAMQVERTGVGKGPVVVAHELDAWDAGVSRFSVVVGTCVLLEVLDGFGFVIVE